MGVDEDGHDRGFLPNIRAIMISRYPGPSGIVGDAILFGETSPPEVRWVSVPEGTLRALKLEKLQKAAEQVVIEPRA